MNSSKPRSDPSPPAVNPNVASGVASNLPKAVITSFPGASNISPLTSSGDYDAIPVDGFQGLTTAFADGRITDLEIGGTGLSETSALLGSTGRVGTTSTSSRPSKGTKGRGRGRKRKPAPQTQGSQGRNPPSAGGGGDPNIPSGNGAPPRRAPAGSSKPTDTTARTEDTPSNTEVISAMAVSTTTYLPEIQPWTPRDWSKDVTNVPSVFSIILLSLAGLINAAKFIVVTYRKEVVPDLTKSILDLSSTTCMLTSAINGTQKLGLAHALIENVHKGVNEVAQGIHALKVEGRGVHNELRVVDTKSRLIIQQLGTLQGSLGDFASKDYMEFKFESLQNEMKALQSSTTTQFKSIDTQLKAMKNATDAQFKSIDTQLKVKFESIDTQLKEMKKSTDAKFELIDTQLKVMKKSTDAQFKGIDAQFEAIDAQLEAMKKATNSKFESLETRLDGIETRLDGIDTTLKAILKALENLQTN